MHKSEANLSYIACKEQSSEQKIQVAKLKTTLRPELFQLFLHACKRLRSESESESKRGARRQSNCLALEMKIESNAKDASASRHPCSRTINNKSAFISSWELFAVVDVCEIKVAWHS